MQIMKFIFILLAFASCTSVQTQGVQGQVFWLSGDQMPGPGKKRSPQQGVVREILFYEATTLAEAKQESNFFSLPNKQPVGTVMSSPEGNFSINLPAGKYSVFVKEQDGLFANLFDGDGCINCISVAPKKMTWITITVDYAAAY